MAAKEANLIASEQYYRTRHVQFQTDVEGLVVARGDVIQLSHDLTSWGTSGRLDQASTTTVLNLLRPVTFASGGGATYYVSVKHPDGTIDTRTCVYPGSATPVSTITLNSALSQNPSAYTGNNAQDAIFLFDPQATPGKKLKIVRYRTSTVTSA